MTNSTPKEGVNIKDFEGHTPAPWRSVETKADGPEFYILPNGESPAIASGLLGRGRRTKESRANAALIAAAPGLLAEVIELRAALAIAKAGGK